MVLDGFVLEREVGRHVRRQAPVKKPRWRAVVLHRGVPTADVIDRELPKRMRVVLLP